MKARHEVGKKAKETVIGYQIRSRDKDSTLVSFMAEDEALPLEDCLRWLDLVAGDDRNQWVLEVIWSGDTGDLIKIVLDDKLRKQLSSVS